MADIINKLGLQDKRYKVSDSQKQQIIAMRENKETYNSIATKTGLSLTTVYKIVNPEFNEREKIKARGVKRIGDRHKDKERRRLYNREYHRAYYHEKIKDKNKKEEK